MFSPLFGAQGWEYLDLGRLWQILLVLGMVLWLRHPVPRATTPAGGREPGQPALSVLLQRPVDPAFYAVGLPTARRPISPSPTSGGSGSCTCGSRIFWSCSRPSWWPSSSCYWAWCRRRPRLRVIYLDAILYSLGGVVGTMHHLYFSGAPAIHMALGAFFSAAEVIPLTFLTVEAWTFLHLGARQEVRGGAGAVPPPLGRHVPGRGRLLEFPGGRGLRLPHQPSGGELLRDRHPTDRQPRPRGLDGCLRMLALALLVFCLRYLMRPEDWSDRWWVSLSGRSTSAWPGWSSSTSSRSASSSWGFGGQRLLARPLDRVLPDHAFIEWLRLPGDVLFIAGVVPLVYLTGQAVLPAAPMPAPEPAGIDPWKARCSARCCPTATPAGPAGGRTP